MNPRALSLCLLGLSLFGATATAANVVTNPGFEVAGSNPSYTTAFGVGAPSAAADWTAYVNTPGFVSTALAASTDTIEAGGATMLGVSTDGGGNGVYQFAGPFDYLAVDVYVTSGVFQLIATNNYGATESIAVSTALNTWQRLNVAYASGNEIALYASGGPAAFFVDDVYAGLTPDTVPEPASWGMMILGVGLAGHYLRRQSKTPATA